MATINKAECNFYSAELRLGGGPPLTGYNKLEYSFKADHELVKGNKRVPLGTSDGGMTDQQGSITVNMATYRAITSRRGWMNARWTLVLVYSLAGQPQHRVVLRNLSFTDNKLSMEEGPKALEKELSFIFERVFEDGFCPVTGEAENGATA
jgi:hypothetical protein